MEWRKSDYEIWGAGAVTNLPVIASGYVCELTEWLKVGITNKLPVLQKDATVKWRPAGFWTMTILPEGLAFKTFKRKKDAQAFIEQEAENLKTYVADYRMRVNNGSVVDYRRRVNHGSVDAAHE